MDEKNPAMLEPKGWFSNAPWWLVSAGIHVVVLLGATLVVMEQVFMLDSSPVAVHFLPSAENKIPNLEPVRDIFDRSGVVTEDKAPDAVKDEAIVFPHAEDSDHNENNVGIHHEHTMSGQDPRFISWILGQTRGIGRGSGPLPGSTDRLGVGFGGGPGGRFGNGRGGDADKRAKVGATTATEGAVDAAIKWLAHHQDPDGSWHAESFSATCVGAPCGGPGVRDYDAGVTGLALLAFLGAGYTHLAKNQVDDPLQPGRKLVYGQTVRNALTWLLGHQDSVGCLGERGPKYMYNHAIACLALTEAYGMTGSPLLKDPAQTAVNFVVQAQNPSKGWRYSERCGDNDSSVTGWCVMALKSAELSDLVVPQSAYQGAIGWYHEVTERGGYHRVGYADNRWDGIVVVPGHEGYRNHPAMTAVAMMARIFVNKNRREPELGGVQNLIQDLPEWNVGKKSIDYYYRYYGSLVMFQYDGPDGPMWSRWKTPMMTALVPNQKTKKDGCQNGSWDPEVDRWGFEGGRVFAVATNALTLEVFYRYPNVFTGVKR